MITSPKRIAKKALLGTALGDGSLSVHPDVKNPTKAKLTLVHGQDQLEYLKWKMYLLQPLVGSYHIKIFPSRAKNKHIIHAVTYSSKYLFHIFNDLYKKEGKKYTKVVRKNVLNRFTPLSYALYYMDNGSTYFKGENLTGIRLATYCFSEEGNKKIQTNLKEKWNINSVVSFRKDGYFYLRLNKKDTINFLDMVHEFIHPDLLYKLQSPYSAKRRNCSYDDIVCSLQQCGELVRNNQSNIKKVPKLVDWKEYVKGPIVKKILCCVT